MAMLTNFNLMEMCKEHNVPLVGVFSKDKLPPKRYMRDGGYVVNLQDDTDEYGNSLDGTHWTAFYVEKGKACYFDSFGFVPPLQVQEFLSSFKPVPYNIKTIQSVRSGVCGWYVFYFLYCMSHSGRQLPLVKRFENFLRIWSDEPKHNRAILEEKLKPI